MSGYETAPATLMLATHCAACGRPLVDAASVEAGMGPDCRKKYWVKVDVSEAARLAANAIVYTIALKQAGDDVIAGIAQLIALGFVVLAERIAKRVNAIQISEVAGRLAVKTPYSEEAVAAQRHIPGRVWDKERKVNTFPLASKPWVWDFLLKMYPGQVALGPKGAFTIGAKAAPLPIPAPLPPAKWSGPADTLKADAAHAAKLAEEAKPLGGCEYCDGEGCRECTPALCTPPFTADDQKYMDEMDAMASKASDLRDQEATETKMARETGGDIETVRRRYAAKLHNLMAM